MTAKYAINVVERGVVLGVSHALHVSDKSIRKYTLLFEHLLSDKSLCLRSGPFDRESSAIYWSFPVMGSRSLSSWEELLAINII